MVISILLAAVLLIQQPSDVSPEGQRLIAPVMEAIQTERDRQAALPAPADMTERFLRMYRLDQQSRAALNKVDLSGLSPEDRQVAERVMWDAIGVLDNENQTALLEMLPPEGWFYKSVYGEGPANTAFLIIQHSNVDLWRRFVPVLEPLVATGEVDGQDYGLMYDRLAINEGRPQRYGSQMICKAGRFVIDYGNLEDPANADARRAAMGFHQTLAEYETNFADYPPCVED